MKRTALAVLLLAATVGPSCVGTATTSRSNLLLVTLDTTRADRIGAYGYERETSPTLDALAAEGVLFERAYSVVPLTTPSHVSMMTGLHPLTHGVYRNAQPMPEEFPTLAAALQREGYATGAFVSAVVLGGPGRIDDGFDVYSEVVDAASAGSSDPRGRMRPADRTIDEALGWLAARPDGPFFLWVHLYDPHLPYLPPTEYGQKFVRDYDAYRDRVERRLGGADAGSVAGDEDEALPETAAEGRGARTHSRRRDPAEVERMRDAYDGEIAFVDAQIARLTRHLDEAGLAERTVVAVVGDHGEILHEKQNYFGHHHFLYEGSLRVPFVLRAPGVRPRRLAERVTTVDLLPTLLAALEVDPPETLDGLSLWPLIRHGRPVVGRPYEIVVSHTRRPGLGPLLSRGLFEPAGVVRGPWKLTTRNRNRTVELFNLERDPEETSNLVEDPSVADIVAELRQTLQSRLRATRARSRRMDPKTRERLESLGYVQ